MDVLAVHYLLCTVLGNLEALVVLVDVAGDVAGDGHGGVRGEVVLGDWGGRVFLVESGELVGGGAGDRIAL